MKVLAIVASARKKHTYNAAKTLLEKLHKDKEIEYEIIMLSELNLKICRGCKSCLDIDERKCPLDDDANMLIEKMKKADGVVFAAPNYSFHVSAYMKVFLDRLAYFFHRPYFFGKSFTSVVAQAVYGGKDILKYFNFIGKAMGFNVCKGALITTLEPISEKTESENNNKIDLLSKRFMKTLKNRSLPKPSLFDLMIFRISRTSVKMKLNEHFRDYNYFLEKGWFESEYYYNVTLNPLTKAFGNLIDYISRKRNKDKNVSI